MNEFRIFIYISRKRVQSRSRHMKHNNKAKRLRVLFPSTLNIFLLRWWCCCCCFYVPKRIISFLSFYEKKNKKRKMISSAKKQKEERNADVMMMMMKILQLDLLNVGHNQSQKYFYFCFKWMGCESESGKWWKWNF